MKRNIIKCRCCNNNLFPFLSFGKMPIANGFLLRKNFKKEYFFDLKVCFCKNCYLFQLFKQQNGDIRRGKFSIKLIMLRCSDLPQNTVI